MLPNAPMIPNDGAVPTANIFTNSVSPPSVFGSFGGPSPQNFASGRALSSAAKAVDQQQFPKLPGFKPPVSLHEYVSHARIINSAPMESSLYLLHPPPLLSPVTLALRLRTRLDRPKLCRKARSLRRYKHSRRWQMQRSRPRDMTVRTRTKACAIWRTTEDVRESGNKSALTLNIYTCGCAKRPDRILHPETHFLM